VIGHKEERIGFDPELRESLRRQPTVEAVAGADTLKPDPQGGLGWALANDVERVWDLEVGESLDHFNQTIDPLLSQF
jgi:hypothetical protein